MAPLIQACIGHRRFDPIVAATAQHRELLDSMVRYFDIPVHHDLGLMRPDQSLADLTSRALRALERLVQDVVPDCIVAQGDTTTVMAASMVAYYHRCPFVHVEAGLRSHELTQPWPEEYNRRVASLTASLHCAPTRSAVDNLRREGVPADRIHLTGNTVVDALLWARRKEHARATPPAGLDGLSEPVILVTAHRRESHEEGLAHMLAAVRRLAMEFSASDVVFPVHPARDVHRQAHQALGDLTNVRLLDPLGYGDFVWLMDRSRLILTDSGGIQEEAPSLGKPVVVMRELTERGEAVDMGAAIVVGTDADAIYETAHRLLSDEGAYERAVATVNPFGDGRAATRIVELLGTLAP